MKPTFNLKPRKRMLITAILGSFLTSCLNSVWAQRDYYDDRQSGREPYISIYQDCDFKGARRDIAVGEFRSMRELDFGNDKMSSIQVPRELEAIIYEHEDFRGDYASVNRDVRCFDRSWNDAVSSLRVEYARDYRANRDNENRRNPVYGGERANQQRDDRSRDRRISNRSANDGVTIGNLGSITFNDQILQRIDGNVWQKTSRTGISQYREVTRDSTSIVLKNEFNNERIRVDLFTNVVTVINTRGQQRTYNIDGRQTLARNGTGQQRNNRPEAVKPAEPNRRIASNCFNYHAYTDGGTGGLRFISKEGYDRFQKSGAKGRICHNGVLPMEITKRDPNTNVYVKISGRVFQFAANEPEDRLENGWYRKHVKLVVGR